MKGEGKGEKRSHPEGNPKPLTPNYQHLTPKVSFLSFVI